MATVREIAISALEEAEASGLKSPYKEFYFQELTRLGFNNVALPLDVSPATTALVVREEHGKGTSVPLDSPYSNVASRLGVDEQTVRSVLNITDTGVSIEVPINRVPTSRAQTARDFTLVIAAMQHILGREARASQVRMVLDDYGRFDSNNFMSSVKQIAPEMLTAKGRPGGKDQELLIRRPGIERAAQIISEWAGD